MKCFNFFVIAFVTFATVLALANPVDKTNVDVSIGLKNAVSPADRSLALDPAVESPDPIDESPDFSPAPESPLFGLSNEWCYKCASLNCIASYLKDIPMEQQFKNGQNIICCNCGGGAFPNAGLCVFPQHMKDSERVSGAIVKEKVERLQRNHCEFCGSRPIHPGDNVHTGETTVNYVKNGCLGTGTGLCR